MEKTLKNVKVSKDQHTKLKMISTVTGIRIGKLVELAVAKLQEDYETGQFGILSQSSKNSL